MNFKNLTVSDFDFTQQQAVLSDVRNLFKYVRSEKEVSVVEITML